MKEINGQVPVYSLFQGNIIYQISLQKQRYRDIGWFTIDASSKIKCFFLNTSKDILLTSSFRTLGYRS